MTMLSLKPFWSRCNELTTLIESIVLFLSFINVAQMTTITSLSIDTFCLEIYTVYPSTGRI